MALPAILPARFAGSAIDLLGAFALAAGDPPAGVAPATGAAIATTAARATVVPIRHRCLVFLGLGVPLVDRLARAVETDTVDHDPLPRRGSGLPVPHGSPAMAGGAPQTPLSAAGAARLLARALAARTTHVAIAAALVAVITFFTLAVGAIDASRVVTGRTIQGPLRRAVRARPGLGQVLGEPD